MKETKLTLDLSRKAGQLNSRLRVGWGCGILNCVKNFALRHSVLASKQWDAPTCEIRPTKEAKEDQG